jgi:putative Mg2+ transporter-C (MgtC) family protein
MAPAHGGPADQRARLGRGSRVVFSMPVAADSSPTRAAAQIVSGIGFLGAGVIMREGLNISGLNTPATLWCSAMVGTFAGAGQLVASAIAAAFILLTNLLLRPLVRLINRQPFGAVEIETNYSVELRCQGQRRPIPAHCCFRPRRVPVWGFVG